MKICLVMLSIALFGAAPVFAWEHKPVPNADFELVQEDGRPVGWRIRKDGHWKIAERKGLNGTRALMFDSELNPEAKGELPGIDIEIDRSKKYLYSVLVRTEGLVDGGVCMCVQCYDKSGRVFYGSYCHEEVRGTTDGWVRFQHVSSANQFPDKAVRLEYNIFIKSHGVPKGRAYIDNLNIVPYDSVLAKVQTMVSSAYQDTAASGKVTFTAALNLKDAEFAALKPRALFRCAGADGKSVVKPADTIDRNAAALTVDVASLAKGTNKVECVVVDGEQNRIGKVSLDFVRTAEPVKRRVDFDQFGRTLVDGKPFFPLGMYASHVRDGELDHYDEAPFNCVLGYWYPSKADLDYCQSRGVMLIASLYHAYSWAKNAWTKTPAEEEPFVRKVVAECAGHPALLAWYLTDEPPVARVDDLVRRRRLLHEIDPDHPTYSCICDIDEMRNFVHSFDVVGPDAYPIGREQIRVSPISQVSEWTRSTACATCGTRPIWFTPQAFDWDWFEKTGNRKFPTKAEFLNMSYQAVADGANGLVYYSWGQMIRHSEDFKVQWPFVREAIAEIAAKIPLFLSDPGPAVVSRSDERLCLRTWATDGGISLLAVNATRETMKAKARLSDGREQAFDLPALGYEFRHMAR